MGFFSKKIKSKKIAESLGDLFIKGYRSTYDELTNLLQTESFNKNQYPEIALIFMVAIERATISTLGYNEKTVGILNAFKDNVFKIFTDSETRKTILKLFEVRHSEYGEVFDQEDEDLALEVGQIFYKHLFYKNAGSKNMPIVIFIGTTYLKFTVDIEKFLEEISSQHEIV